MNSRNCGNDRTDGVADEAGTAHADRPGAEPPEATGAPRQEGPTGIVDPHPVGEEQAAQNRADESPG